LLKHDFKAKILVIRLACIARKSAKMKIQRFLVKIIRRQREIWNENARLEAIWKEE